MTEPVNNIPVERLHELFSYNPDTGQLIAKTHNPKRLVGSVAGSKSTLGYINVFVDNRNCKAHRVIWALAYGYWPDMYIDHINGVRDDNRLENLRMADSLQNNFNRGTQRRDKSGFKGVCIKKGSKRWVAQITIDGKRKHLGLFDTAEEAAAAYDAVAKQIHGAFFKPNQIDSRIAA